MLEAAGAPFKDEQPRCVPRLGWSLGNRIGREVVLEVVDPKAARSHAESVAPGRANRPGAIGLQREFYTRLLSQACAK